MPDVIEINPNVMGGQPVIKGTRVPVARIVALYIQGYTLRDFKKDYPYLELSKKNLLQIFTFYKNRLGKN